MGLICLHTQDFYTKSRRLEKVLNVISNETIYTVDVQLRKRTSGAAFNWLLSLMANHNIGAYSNEGKLIRELKSSSKGGLFEDGAYSILGSTKLLLYSLFQKVLANRKQPLPHVY